VIPELLPKFDWLNYRLQNAAVVVVVCATMLWNLPGLAQTNAAPGSQSVSSITKSGAKSGMPAATPPMSNHLAMRPRIALAKGASPWHVSTPFEQVLQPLLNRQPSLSRKSSDAAKRNLGSQAAISGDNSDPVNLNFPGFFTAPYISASPITDATPLFVSVTGDFNHDGKPDIATINEDGRVNVMLNSGASDPLANGISYSDTSAIANSPLIGYAIAADLNGDGNCDIVGMDINNSALVLWINNGKGGFRPAVSVPVLPANGAIFGEGGAIAVGDVNGDGTLDVVAVSDLEVQNRLSGRVSTNIATQVFAGDGLGNLEPPSEVDSTLSGAVATGFGQGMQLADMTGDGTLDIVINMQVQPVPTANFVMVSLNTAGAFAPFEYGVNESHVGSVSDSAPDVEVADVNGDGFPDVLWNPGGPTSGVIAVAFGDGTGALSQIGATAAADNIPGLGLFHLADVNGDGKLDILTYNNGSVAVFPGNGDGTFSTYPLNVYTASDGSGDQQPAVLDYNGDGKPDIVYVDSELSLATFYAGHGDGSFRGASSVAPETVNPANLQITGSGDLNGDGIPDLVAFDSSQELAGLTTVPDIMSLLSDGKGGFKETLGIPAATLKSLGFNFSNIAVFPTVVDLNGDGRADIILSNATGIYTALGNADGSFQTPVLIPGLAIQCEPLLSDAGNIDGSGHTSLIFAYPGDASCGGTGQVPPGVLILLNDGKANFTASVEPIGSQPFQAKLADLDGDGYPDLLLSDIDAATGVFALYTLPNQGASASTDGQYFDPTRRNTLLSGYAISDILLDDYNGDGIQDLALATAGEVDDGNLVPQTEGVLLLPGQGGFAFGAPNLVAQGTIASWAQWADINQDGIPDLIIASEQAEVNDAPVFGMSVLPGLGNGLFASPVSQVFPDSDTYVFIGDFNQDGAPDVAVNGVNSTGAYAGLYLNRGADSVALSVSSASVGQGSPITLTASLRTSFADVPPGGTVTFTSNGTVFGTSSLSSGVASLTYNVGATSATGVYPVAAAYSGDGHFNQASAIGSYSVTALAPAISTSASSTSINLMSGQSAVATLTLSANATYNGTVAFAATSSGSGVTVAVNPSTVTLNGGQTQQVSVVIGTGSVSTAASRRDSSSPRRLAGTFAGTLTLAALFPLCLRRIRRLRSRWLLALVLCASLGCLAGTIGCSSGSSTPVPVAGTQTVVVTVTPSVSGVAAQTITFNVNLQ